MAKKIKLTLIKIMYFVTKDIIHLQLIITIMLFVRLKIMKLLKLKKKIVLQMIGKKNHFLLVYSTLRMVII